MRQLHLAIPVALCAVALPHCSASPDAAPAATDPAIAASAPPVTVPTPAALNAHVPPIVSKLAPIGRLDPERRLRITFALPLRDQAGLDRLLAELYDPSSPRYRQYLTPQEFGARFSPPEEDYAKVVAFAQASGLDVAMQQPDRTLLTVEAPVARIEAALRVTMNEYRHPIDARTFFAPANEPSLGELPVMHVDGLDDLRKPHAATAPRPPDNSAPTGSGVIGLYQSRDLRAAYAPGVTLDGAGQVVGLYDPGYGFAPSDITAYQDRNHLPHVPVVALNADGQYHQPRPDVDEPTMDIELALAMAPALSEVVMYTGDLLAAFKRMATDNIAKQVSISYSPGGAGSTFDAVYQQMAAQGQTVFESSGDDGAYFDGNPQYGDDPYITFVGGTDVWTYGAGGSYMTEKAWNEGGATGGGFVGSYPLPWWQQGLATNANGASTVFRNYPDVAMPANQLEEVFKGTAQWTGGTSASSPLWAGFMALVNQQAASLTRPSVGFLNPTLYALGKSGARDAVFNDVIWGDNASFQHIADYQSVVGYDLTTGWGSPKGQPLIDQLVGYPALPWSGQWASYGMPALTQIAANVGPDGRLGAFGLTSAVGAVSETPQAWVNGGWSSPGSLGGSQISNFAVGRNADGRMEVFAIGGDNALWHISQVNATQWSAWSSLGGWGLRQVTVAREQDGRLRAFVLGGDRNVYAIAQNGANGAGGWGSYINLGGAPLAQIVAGNDANGAIEVLGVSTSGGTQFAVETAPNSSAWTYWGSLGGWVSQITVGQNQDGRLEVYGIGSGGTVWHQWRTPSGGWSGWVSLGGAAKDVAVTRELNGSIDVFIVGTDGRIYVNDQHGPNGGWGSIWVNLGNGPFSHVAAATNPNGHVELFGLTTSGDLQHTWQTIPSNL